MKSKYGLLILFRAVTAAVNVFLIAQMGIPFDLIVMLIGVPFARNGVRAVIFGLEVMSLMLSLLSLFFGNYVGGVFNTAVSAACIYALCRPDIKERFA